MVKDHSDTRGRKYVLFNNVLNTFYLRLYGVRHMVKNHSDSKRKEMFYLTTYSTHFIYGYMASVIYMVKDHSDSKRKEMFYLMTYSTHFIYGYMASDI